MPWIAALYKAFLERNFWHTSAIHPLYKMHFSSHFLLLLLLNWHNMAKVNILYNTINLYTTLIPNIRYNYTQQQQQTYHIHSGISQFVRLAFIWIQLNSKILRKYPTKHSCVWFEFAFLWIDWNHFATLNQIKDFIRSADVKQ